MALKPKRSDGAKGPAERLRLTGGKAAAKPVLYRIDLKEHLRTPGVRARLERVRRLTKAGGRGHAPRP